MKEPDKDCVPCNRRLRCVYTGCYVYLAGTGKTYCADLFCCFGCLRFYVFGMNRKALECQIENMGERTAVLPAPNVVVASPVIVPYGRVSEFAEARGYVIPLPSALLYMSEKCGHAEEVARYLKPRNKGKKP